MPARVHVAAARRRPRAVRGTVQPAQHHGQRGHRAPAGGERPGRVEDRSQLRIQRVRARPPRQRDDRAGGPASPPERLRWRPGRRRQGDVRPPGQVQLLHRGKPAPQPVGPGARQSRRAGRRERRDRLRRGGADLRAQRLVRPGRPDPRHDRRRDASLALHRGRRRRRARSAPRLRPGARGALEGRRARGAVRSGPAEPGRPAPSRPVAGVPAADDETTYRTVVPTPTTSWSWSPAAISTATPRSCRPGSVVTSRSP